MGRFIDLTGKRYGDWTVLHYLGASRWECRCEKCRECKPIKSDKLRNGLTGQCAECKQKEDFQDLTGKRFSDWIVLKYLGGCLWECRCSCGAIKEVNGSNLRSGRSTRCQICSGREQDIIGKIFGRLQVINEVASQRYVSPDGKSRYTRRMYACRCSCGNPEEVVVSGDHLRNQGTQSCGCLRSEAAKARRTHGMTIDGPDGKQTPEYGLWARAKRRAKQEGLPFDIDPTDIVVPEICPLLGCRLKIGDGASQDSSPSLDKIDPAKGYVRGNVWVISHLANRIKTNATLEQLELVAKGLRSALESIDSIHHSGR